jgi:large subunit ribosomal protein L10Ae
MDLYNLTVPLPNALIDKMRLVLVFDSSLLLSAVLRMEQEILKFIRDPRRTDYEFNGLPTSYLRLAAHRLAQHYFLQSIAIPDNSLPDGTGSRIILRKTSSECRLPAVRLADIPVNLPQEENISVAKVAIKQRPQKNLHGMNSSSAHSSRENLQKSVEERKEEYNKARARIFNNSNSSNATDGRSAEEVTLPSTLHRSTSLELNASNRMGQGAEITLERSLTTTSASSRSNRSKIDKEPAVNRNRQNNRVAIFRDRESERKDPDYDRSYDRSVSFLVTHLFAAILLAHHEKESFYGYFYHASASIVSYALYVTAF